MNVCIHIVYSSVKMIFKLKITKYGLKLSLLIYRYNNNLLLVDSEQSKECICFTMMYFI